MLGERTAQIQGLMWFRYCERKNDHIFLLTLLSLEPYIAPEEFTGEPYDARKVDIWSAGIIYYAMIFHGVPWRSATTKDPNYVYYVNHRHGHFEPFLRLHPQQARLFEKVLEPDPLKRVVIEDLLQDPFFLAIDVCDTENLDSQNRKHHHFTSQYETNLEHARQQMHHMNVTERKSSPAHFFGLGIGNHDNHASRKDSRKSASVVLQSSSPAVSQSQSGEGELASSPDLRKTISPSASTALHEYAPQNPSHLRIDQSRDDACVTDTSVEDPASAQPEMLSATNQALSPRRRKSQDSIVSKNSVCSK